MTIKQARKLKNKQDATDALTLAGQVHTVNEVNWKQSSRTLAENVLKSLKAGLTVQETANIAGISRQHVYTIKGSK